MYVTEKEIPIYCPIVKSTTINHINSACFLIDAYKGSSFEVKKYKELVKFTKISKYKNPFEPYRGKLKHLPRVEIKKVYTNVINIFGEMTEKEYSVNNLYFDEDNSPYFSFYPPRNIVDFVPINNLKEIIVVYKAGYEQYPEQLKRAVGMLAQNLAQMGGTLEWESRDDYDVKLTLKNGGVFTNEIKRLVDTIKLQ